MPSIPHEVPAELLRHNPGLGMALIYYEFPIPPGAQARLGDSNLSTVVPLFKELRGDAVVVLETEAGDWKRVVIVEPQLSAPRPWKRRSMAAYVTTAGAVHDCDSTLLVICYDPQTARECRKTIRTGHPRFNLTPWVIYGHRTPDPFDPALEFARHELVVLACFTKRIDLDDKESRDKVLECLKSLDDERRTKYFHYVTLAATETALSEMEKSMPITIPEDSFVGAFIAVGRAEEARSILLHLMEVRKLEVSSAVRMIVNSSTRDLVELWLDRAVTAASLDEIFAGHDGWESERPGSVAAA